MTNLEDKILEITERKWPNIRMEMDVDTLVKDIKALVQEQVNKFNFMRCDYSKESEYDGCRYKQHDDACGLCEKIDIIRENIIKELE